MGGRRKSTFRHQNPNYWKGYYKARDKGASVSQARKAGSANVAKRMKEAYGR